MDDVTAPARGRHDLVIPKSLAPQRRVVVRSFDVDGPAAMVDRFVAVGLRLQRAVPHRLVQPEAQVRHRLSSAFDWYDAGIARHFVATIDGRDVGRCSAMVDARMHGHQELPTGLVGMWECEDGEAGRAAAHALLELATAWLRVEGARRIVGPVDFSTWHGYRFRDGDGDGRTPLLLEPVTPDHSIRQWESFGFTRDEAYFSAEIMDPVATMLMARPVARELIAQGWRVRQLRMRDWDALIGELHAMSMAEFTRQPYFASIPLEAFRALHEPLRSRIDPRYVHTAIAPDGELAGFVIGVRELGSAARALQAGGVAGRATAARAAWRADTLMVKTICVARHHRERGVALLMQHALYQAALDTGHRRICNMLMHANNRSRLLTELSGGREFRRYVTLARAA